MYFKEWYVCKLQGSFSHYNFSQRCLANTLLINFSDRFGQWTTVLRTLHESMGILQWMTNLERYIIIRSQSVCRYCGEKRGKLYECAKPAFIEERRMKSKVLNFWHGWYLFSLLCRNLRIFDPIKRNNHHFPNP